MEYQSGRVDKRKAGASAGHWELRKKVDGILARNLRCTFRMELALVSPHYAVQAAHRRDLVGAEGGAIAGRGSKTLAPMWPSPGASMRREQLQHGGAVLNLKPWRR
jgi:hypothetical protein